MLKGTAKKRKGNPKHAPCTRDGSKKKHYFNLMLPIPQGDSTEQLLLMQQAVDRLSSIGYTHIAFCHTVYGKVKPDDSADKALCQISKLNQNNLRILKRLHLVVENLSDVGYYTIESTSIKTILQNYDLISLSPRNELVFTAACATATLIDIITLDYTSGRGGVQLPYKIRTPDIKAASERGAVFELQYSPAILTLGQRKAFVAAAQLFQSNSLGCKPKVLLSSGDSNVMALRAPGDLINLMTTVLQFNPTISYAALGETGNHIINTATRRKFGKIADVYLENNGCTRLDISNEDKDEKVLKLDGEDEIIGPTTVVSQVDSDVEDGFITL